ncbi:hypothetical protein CCACVL1_30272 [Corchorus capsularis]|uniref:Uncharacterized protein n=1 Tax=Corchorus capsularis TaxID=210143 RepID=A0A1R3FY63_COCAP|nr:hypothetical protein CCACVL1_30272 [Corchorus capsularis]
MAGLGLEEADNLYEDAKSSFGEVVVALDLAAALSKDDEAKRNFKEARMMLEAGMKCLNKMRKKRCVAVNDEKETSKEETSEEEASEEEASEEEAVS